MFFLLATCIKAQTFYEKVAIKSCDCFSSLETLQELEDSVVDCVSAAMSRVLNENPADEMEILNTVDGVNVAFEEVGKLLYSYCYSVRRLIINEKESEFYQLSSNQKANEHYSTGNYFMDKGDYKKSISEFKKAVKIDKNFVLAYDHLAISYRRLEKFKQALKYYQKSMDIYPEGYLAILNTAVIYSFMNDYDKSLNYYNFLTYLYADDPEGYFGAGKILFLKSDYKNALENVFIAHIMYVNTNNTDYIKDSEHLISLMYKELKEKGMLDLFNEVAEKFNIKINEDENQNQ